VWREQRCAIGAFSVALGVETAVGAGGRSSSTFPAVSPRTTAQVFTPVSARASRLGDLNRSSPWCGSGIRFVPWVFGRFGAFGSCLPGEDRGVLDELQRLGLEGAGGRLGELLEGGGVAV
jgi:hypothetical protein